MNSSTEEVAMAQTEVTITIHTTVDALEAAGLRTLLGMGAESAEAPGKVTYLGRAPKGSRLHEREYRFPLLEVLAERGGSATLREATDAMEEKLRDSLAPIDWERNPSGRGIRWRNRVQWVRARLVRDGLLKPDSPRGVWELTDAGWKELKRARRDQHATKKR